MSRERICLRQQHVLAGLARAVEAGLELALAGGNDQHADVGLGSTGDHVGDIVLVARRVQHRVAVMLRAEIRATHLDSDALVMNRQMRSHLRTLLVVRVHDVGEEPALSVADLGLALVLLDGTLVDETRGVHDVAADGGLAGIDVADEDDVDVVARILLRNQLVEGVAGGLPMSRER